MKKTLISLAAASLVASSAFAADTGIDIKVGGQAAVYYETHDMNGMQAGTSLFDEQDSVASWGIQLNLGADLGNNFTFGSQISYLGAAGLEKNLVNNVKQTGGTTLTGSTTDEFALTKLFIAKQIGNTTLKLGRQELPKSLSPLAFSEGWNVFKNTFDAIVAINTDIPKTTLVGAYVSAGTGMTLGTTANLAAQTQVGGLGIAGEAYMITASTTAIPMTTVTGSYYTLNNIAGAPSALSPVGVNPTGGISADAYWLDVAVADKELPVGLKIGLQAGLLAPDSYLGAVALADTEAYGAKISLAPIDALSLTLAYTSVDGDNNKVNVAFRNTGSTKTPLFTQMIYNQNTIALDSDTLMVKASYNMGDMGSITAAYGMSDNGQSNAFGTSTGSLGMAGADYNEFDLIYKIKAGGVQYFAAYVNRDIDAGGVMNTTTTSFMSPAVANTLSTTTSESIVRLWARYNF